MKARFFRSDAMAERGGEVEDRVIESEWFQITYNQLRSAPNGDTLATFRSELDIWECDGVAYSDVVIHEDA